MGAAFATLGANSDGRFILGLCIFLCIYGSSIRYAWSQLRWPVHPGIVLEVCLPFLDIHLAEW